MPAGPGGAWLPNRQCDVINLVAVTQGMGPSWQVGRPALLCSRHYNGYCSGLWWCVLPVQVCAAPCFHPSGSEVVGEYVAGCTCSEGKAHMYGSSKIYCMAAESHVLSPLSALQQCGRAALCVNWGATSVCPYACLG